jgi:hypothetical protein
MTPEDVPRMAQKPLLEVADRGAFQLRRPAAQHSSIWLSVAVDVLNYEPAIGEQGDARSQAVECAQNL